MKNNKYNKYAVFGCGGMLGESFLNILPSNTFFSDKNITNEHIKYCDIRNFNDIRVQLHYFNPDIIINLAAITDLEYAENNPDDCFLTNSIAAIKLFELSKELNIPYVFISTAGIFGSDKEYYSEEDHPAPLSIYGKSKYYTEQFLLNQSYDKFYIFRAGWMMGGGRKLDKKFVNKIIKLIDCGSSELFVVDDKLGVPTYTRDFAKSILFHIENDLPYGLYNQVCNGEASRYDVAIEIVNYLNLDLKVTKVESSFFKNEYFAPRPFSEKLVNKKLNDLNRNYMRDWKLCLHEYLDEHFK